MKSISLTAATIAIAAASATANAEIRPPAPATAASSASYTVTITNITRGQSFTPILVASHEPGVRLFELGQPASPELVAVAENGDLGPLSGLLLSDPRVGDLNDSGGLLFPGESVTVEVAAGGRFTNLSLAAMLLPTNDGFITLNGIPGPRAGETVAVRIPGYDAGSEVNDESCASIPGPGIPFPGPECGLGGSPGGGEGYVHIHAGIHGIGDLASDERDWHNPVAAVVIRQQ